MIHGKRIVVVVPAFEEEAHIGRVIAGMPAFVDLVVVVDDGSCDRTADVAAACGDGRVHLIRHPRQRGVGAAIASGYRAALERTVDARDVLAVMAGDGQMDPDDLRAVVEPVARGEADYVKGDRFGDPGVRAAMGWPRWVGGQVFTRLTSLAIGQRVSDSQCGFTALSRGAASALDLVGLWPSFGYPNDLLGQLAARGFSVREVPVRPVYGDERSKLRLRHLPAIFFLVARAAARRARAGAVSSATEKKAGGCVPSGAYHSEQNGCEPRVTRRVPAEASER